VWACLKSIGPVFTRELPRTQKALAFYQRYIDRHFFALKFHDHIATVIAANEMCETSGFVFVPAPQLRTMLLSCTVSRLFPPSHNMSDTPWSLQVAWRLIKKLTPWLRTSQEVYFETVEAVLSSGGSMPRNPAMLDIGCGKEFLMDWLRVDLYRKWKESICGRAVIYGIDPHLASLRQNASRINTCAFADHMPFRGETFDLVTANMVVEHIGNPSAVLNEVVRVLRPGGLFLFHTPNLQSPLIGLSHILPYSIKRALVPIIEGGRDSDDVFPTRYRLNKRKAIETEGKRAGFEIQSVNPIFTSPFSQMLGPLVVFELLAIRTFRGPAFANFRPDLICILRKPTS
jgi:ubiquinone/menaquinone biosynthesis C-methylase UbiE